jgi:hypothetical protein
LGESRVKSTEVEIGDCAKTGYFLCGDRVAPRPNNEERLVFERRPLVNKPTNIDISCGIPDEEDGTDGVHILLKGCSPRRLGDNVREVTCIGKLDFHVQCFGVEIVDKAIEVNTKDPGPRKGVDAVNQRGRR